MDPTKNVRLRRIKAKRTQALLEARSGRGFTFELRRSVRARLSRRPKTGPFSRGYFIDAYGDRISLIDEQNPAVMEFATHYVHPCNGVKRYGSARKGN